jgi:hypothetical protein
VNRFSGKSITGKLTKYKEQIFQDRVKKWRGWIKTLWPRWGLGRNELAIIDMDFDDLMRLKILAFDLRYRMEFPC